MPQQAAKALSNSSDLARSRFFAAPRRWMRSVIYLSLCLMLFAACTSTPPASTPTTVQSTATRVSPISVTPQIGTGEDAFAFE
jgi:hypothetical protein